MLALAQPIKERLSALSALQGWQVRLSTELQDRAALPAVDVRMAGGAVGAQRAGAVAVRPGWSVVLQVRRGPQAADELEQAFAQVVESLHGWRPGEHAQRGWEAFELSQAADAVFGDDGIAGIELIFSTQALYTGQQ